MIPGRFAAASDDSVRKWIILSSGVLLTTNSLFITLHPSREAAARHSSPNQASTVHIIAVIF